MPRTIDLKRSLLFALLCLGLFACKTAVFQVKDSNTARSLLLYNQSIEFLQKEYAAEKDPIKQQKLAFNLGDSYQKLNDYANAEKWYKQSLDLNGGEQSLYRFGLMQKQQEKYEEAVRTFEQYQRIANAGFEGRKQANQSRDAIEWKKTFSKIQVTNLQALNSPASDFDLQPYKSGQFIFSSARTEATGNLTDGWTGEKPYDLFTAEKKENGFSVPVGFPAPVNSLFHEATPVFSKDYKEMYFVRCKQDELKSNQFCHVYYSAFNNEHWSEPVRMEIFPDTVNVYDPYLSKDGKLLLFAADVPGNFGETDLYFAAKADSGWGTPQNLGGAINTPGSERSPWLDEKGNLYFASNGLPGMGGLDIFKAIHSKAGYKDPQNLKYPINSGGDDFAFWIDKYKPQNSEDTVLYAGYFTSNRSGGKGSDDLYRFEEKWINIFVLKGKVVEKQYEDPKNPDSKILGLTGLAGAKVELRNTDDKTMATATSDTGGNFTFKLNAETDYKLFASKVGYLGKSDKTSTKGLRHQDSTVIYVYSTLELEKIFTTRQLVIPNIYYDYDKTVLRPESKVVLDSILVFFKENPDLVVELGSHTDSRGSDAYNLKLSQGRAQSCVDYLIEKGIPADHLVAKGYGETSPVNKCVNGVKCTEEEYQLNRRTTLRVISSKINLESIEPENIKVDPKPGEK